MDNEKMYTTIMKPFDGFINSIRRDISNKYGPTINFFINNGCIKNNDMLTINNDKFYISHNTIDGMDNEEFMNHIIEKYNIHPINLLNKIKVNNDKSLKDEFDRIYDIYFNRLVSTLTTTSPNIHTISLVYNNMKPGIKLLSYSESDPFYEFLNGKYPGFFDYEIQRHNKNNAIDEIDYGSSLLSLLDSHISGKVGTFIMTSDGRHYIVTSGHSCISMFSQNSVAISNDPPGNVIPFIQLKEGYSPSIDIGMVCITSSFIKCILDNTDCTSLGRSLGIEYGSDRYNRAPYRPIVVTEELLAQYLQSEIKQDRQIIVYRYVRNGMHAEGILKNILQNESSGPDVEIVWGKDKFASPGDSGSLYYIIVDNKKVPIAIHRASIPDKRLSYGIILSSGLKIIEQLTQKRFYMCNH